MFLNLEMAGLGCSKYRRGNSREQDRRGHDRRGEDRRGRGSSGEITNMPRRNDGNATKRGSSSNKENNAPPSKRQKVLYNICSCKCI